MFLRHHHRRRIAWLLLFGLLFQQVAMVAYACPLPRLPVDPVEMAESCAAMGMKQAQDNPALCAKHCNPDSLLLADHAAPSVPALALPPSTFSLVLATPVSHVAQWAAVPTELSDPPPRLRYCSLLI